MAKKKDRPKPEKTLEELAKEKYGDHPLAKRIIEDADTHGTREMIEDGRSVLPHIQDATRHFARVDAEKAAAEGEDE
jgi:hypothetical protein